MKVLSLLQPWASLVVLGHKRFECRGWRTAYRGPLVIHASARRPTRREKHFFETAAWFERYIANMDHLPFGALIGTVTLDDILETGWLIQNLEAHTDSHWPQELAFDDYSAGRYAWKLSGAKELNAWLPVKGTLGLWEYEGRVD